MARLRQVTRRLGSVSVWNPAPLTSMAPGVARGYVPGMKPSLAMIVLRAAILVALAIFANRLILDAASGQFSVWGVIMIVIMVGLAAWIAWGLWGRYAKGS